MYGKKKLFLWAVVFALAIPILLVGTASAKYRSDGAVQNATTGVWEVADPGQCYLKDTATTGHIEVVSVPTGSTFRDACRALISVITVTTDCTAADAVNPLWKGRMSGTVCTGNVVYNNDYTANPREGCLHCHNGSGVSLAATKTEYLKTGHKNMLRKVTAGTPQLGPNDLGIIEEYVTDGTNTFDWVNGTISTATGTHTLLWIYGDWIAPAPTAMYLDSTKNMSYSCSKCHATGTSVDASVNTAKEPFVSFPSLTTSLGTGKGQLNLALGLAGYTTNTNASWDQWGIMCSRCHSSATNAGDALLTEATCTAAGYKWVTGHSNYCSAPDLERVKWNPDLEGTDAVLLGTHQSTPSTGAGVVRMCGECHRQEVSGQPYMFVGTIGTLSGGTPTTWDPGFGDQAQTVIGGLSHGAPSPAVGHNYMNVFLNGAHGQFTGTYSEITDTTKYASAFMKQAPDGLGMMGCTGCHNVHESLVVNGHEPLENECTDCHDASGSDSFSTPIASIAHPEGPNTPFENAADEPSIACEKCHMPQALHLFRINSSATYSTKDDYTVTGPDTVVSTGTYTSAVWVDLDLACGQCHTEAGPAHKFTKAQLQSYAEAMHLGGAVPSTTCTDCHTTLNNTNHHDITNATGCLQCHPKAGQRPAETTCLGCHGKPNVTPNYPNGIIPEGVGDNHHYDHGNCGACHGTFGGLAPVTLATKGTYSGQTLSLAADGGKFCLACHGNTGTYGKHHAVPALVDARMDCMTCHTGSAGVPGAISESSGSCLICHSRTWTATTGATVRTVIQGTNHHKGDCLTCHKGEPFVKLATGDLSTLGTYSAVTSQLTTTLKPAGSHNPLPYWSIDTSVVSLCVSCHATAQQKAAGGSTVAIAQSGANDNHHNGHSSVPGTSFGGVSEANGSRGDNDPGMNCVGCHGKATILSGDNATGYIVQIAGSGLSSSTVAAQNGRTNTSGLCLGCHEVVQSGATKDHHSGECVNCHRADGTWSGTVMAGSTVVPAGKTNDCLNCHDKTQSKLAGGSTGTVTPGVDHHSGSCEECHTAVGGVPAMPVMTATDKTSVTNACQTCHASDQLRSATTTTIRAIIPSGAGDNHHAGSSTTTARSVAGCLYCHGPVGGLAFGSANAENMLDQVAPGSCSGACHASSQASSGTHHTGAGVPSTNNTVCVTCHAPTSGGAAGVTEKKYDVILSDGTHTMSLFSQGWVDCTACHGATPATGTISINQSGANRNHHVGNCDNCHSGAGVPAMPAPSNTVTAGRIDDTIITSCLTCHQNDQLRSSDSTTLHAIHPKLNTYGGVDDANGNQADNHHRGHSNTPKVGGDPGMYCLGCHGSVTVTGNTYKITGSGMPTTDVSTQKGFTGGDDATSSLCKACHSSVTQSGATKNHHAGTCLTCHVNEAVPGGAGVTDQCVNGPANAACDAGHTVSYKPGNVAAWATCTQCHNTTGDGTMSGPSTSHHRFAAGTSCEECHVSAGTRPALTNCTDCHGETINKLAITAMRINSITCVSCHKGLGGVKPTGAVCQDCHKMSLPTANSMAKNIHKAILPKTAFTWAVDTKTNLTVKYVANSVTCPKGAACTYEWAFGDGSLASSSTKTRAISHTFPSAGPFTTTLTVESGNLNGTSLPYSAKVTSKYVVSSTPVTVAIPASLDATGYTLNIPSISAIVGGGTGAVTVVITWGDIDPKTGLPYKTKVTLGVGSDSLTHVYKKPGAYTMIMVAKDAGVTISGKTFVSKVKTTKKIRVLPYYIAGTVTDQNDMPVAGVVLTLKQGGTKRLSTSSNILGQYLFSNVRPEPLTSKATMSTSYSLVVTKAGYSFGTNNVYLFDGNPNPVIAPDRSSQFIFQDVKGSQL